MNQTKFELNGIFIKFFTTHSLATRHDAQSTFSAWDDTLEYITNEDANMRWILSIVRISINVQIFNHRVEEEIMKRFDMGIPKLVSKYHHKKFYIVSRGSADNFLEKSM